MLVALVDVKVVAAVETLMSPTMAFNGAEPDAVMLHVREVAVVFAEPFPEAVTRFELYEAVVAAAVDVPV